MLQSRSITKGKFGNGVCDMKLDRVQAYVETSADVRVGHAVANGMCDSPLGWSQDVGMTGAPAWHFPGF